MKSKLVVFVCVLAGMHASVISLCAQERGFYRIHPSGNSHFIGFQADGTSVWTNTLLGSTGKLQRTTSLPATEGDWADVQVFTVTGSVLTTRLPFEPIPAGMILIPGGTNVGSDPDPDFGAYSLTVDSFYMDRYLVTKALWDQVRSWGLTNGYIDLASGRGKGANHPVQTVTWYDAVKWCNARSERDGRTPAYYTSTSHIPANIYRTGTNDLDSSWVQWGTGYRLPSGTEWEFAARGGLVGKRFPWGDEINHSYANYTANGSAFTYDTSPYTVNTFHPTYNDGTPPFTSPIGSFAANGYGLYDMVGNARQWCFDWGTNHVGSMRMMLGGGWADLASGCRIGTLSSMSPAYTNIPIIGLRSVLSPRF